MEYTSYESQFPILLLFQAKLWIVLIFFGGNWALIEVLFDKRCL